MRQTAMEIFILFLGLQGILLTSAMEDNGTTIEMSTLSEFAESDYNFTFGFTEETSGNTRGVPLMQYQDISNLRVYKGPLPKFPGTTTSPWIALHSPVRMYIPIRNTGEVSAESDNCIQCPRNLIIYLSPRKRYILTPVPTISICPSFARQTGRVHVAVVSGPRPAERLYAGRHQVELMVWKADGPVHSCKYTILVKGRRRVPVLPKRLPCPQPEHPSDGVLLCDGNGKKYYPHDSVCQIFCPTNYLVANTSRNSSTIICKNGQWNPRRQISCVAEFCPDLPRIGEHSYWNCNVEDSTKHFRNGTRCIVNCASGYTIPASESEKDFVICNPPTWDNVESIPVCKRAHLPKLRFCQNRHLYVRPGQLIKVSSFMLPKGTNHAGTSLAPICSMQGKSLPKGQHENICEVIDPELQTSQKCSYQINIEENSGPYPHPGDCKNRTIFASPKGTIHIKPARFLTKVGKPVRTKVLRSTCKPKGDLDVGNHFVFCKVTDSHTKLTATCSYWLNVQKRTCSPMKEILNGQIICTSREVGSVCHYKCNPGYSFVGKDLSKTTKVCQPNRRWEPFLNPACEIDTPTVTEGCDNLEVQMNSTDNFAVPLPIFQTAVNETLNVSCLPRFVKTAGLHQVLCHVDDEFYNATCQFNVSVLFKDELVPETSDVLSKGDYPKLVHGCNNLEVNLSAPIHYTVPIPQYLTTLNETLNFSCMPILLTAAGQHEILCKSDNDELNISCFFNVSIHIENGSIPSLSPPKDPIFQLMSGCKNIIVNTSLPVNFTIPQPEYQSTSNDTVLSSCVPPYINTTGSQIVNCTVTDNKAISLSCQFNVTVTLSQDEDTDIIPSEKENCKPLIPPLHGTVECTSEGQAEICQVTCDPGFGFPEDDFLSAVCNGDPGGSWNIQNFHFNNTLPDCLPQLEGSAVEVWISFEAFATHCAEEIQEEITDLISEMCEEGTNCSKIFINCTLNEESDMMLMIVNWTVQADFIDEEHYDNEEIPEAEIRLEAVMENTRKFLASENIPEGVQLFPDSFRKGFITLVCPDAFVPNTLMSKCVMKCTKEIEFC